MTVLFMEWKSYGNEDLVDTFEAIGFFIVRYPFDKKIARNDLSFETNLTYSIEEHHPEFVFSFNYFPIISKVCNNLNTKYVSWVYDSPHVTLYSCTLINKCNYVFLFDKSVYLEFLNAGIETVHYLPLAVNIKRLDNMLGSVTKSSPIPTSVTPFVGANFHASVSFVGSLYSDKQNNLYSRFENLPEFTKGYIDGIVQSQYQSWEYNLLEAMLKPDIVQTLYSAYPMNQNTDGVETKEYLYSQYVLCRYLTMIDRTSYIEKISEIVPLHLFTSDATYKHTNVINHGKIDYYDHMPYIFRNTDINLNITLRSIHTGVPLRAMDIMGCGGFLLSNYQEDFSDFFVSNEDYIDYLNCQDMISKIKYYESHDKERQQIALNGYEKVKEYCSYSVRVEQILNELK